MSELSLNLTIPAIQYLNSQFSPFSIPGLTSYYDSSNSAYANGAVNFILSDQAGLQIPSNASLLTGAGVSFSVGGWINTPGNHSTAGVIVGKLTGLGTASQNEWSVYTTGITTQNLTFETSNGTTITSLAWGSSLLQNTWYYFTASYNASTQTMSLSVNNGTPVTQTSVGNIATSSANYFTLGSKGFTNLGNFFNGAEDSVWYAKNYIPTATESTAIYNNGLGQTYSTAQATPALATLMANMTSWWNCDEPNGIRYDSVTASGNNLSMYFAPMISSVGPVNNGGFETGTLSPWVAGTVGTSTVAIDSLSPHTGTYDALLTVDIGGDLAQINQAVLTVGNTYTMSAYVKDATGTSSIVIGDASTSASQAVTTSYALYSSTFIASTISAVIKRTAGLSASAIFNVDDVTLTANSIGTTAGIPIQFAIDNNLGASFNGTSQYLSVASNASLQPGSGNFALATWVNFSQLPATQQVIFAKGTTGASNEEFRIFYQSSSINLSVSPTGTSTTTINDTTTIIPNVWYLITAWYDGSNIWLSVNNDTPTSTSYSSGTTAGSAPFIIGSTTGGGNYVFGTINGALFMKRALTSAEITAMFNNGKGTVDFTSLPSTVQATINAGSGSYWDLKPYSNGTGAVTRPDSGPNGNNLTDNGNTPSGQGLNYYEGTVAQWNDSSTFANNLTQTTQANRLLYKTNYQNGLPMLVGDGLTKNLSNANDLVGIGSITFTCVFKLSAQNLFQRLIDNGKFVVYINSSTGAVSVESDGTTIALGASSAIVTGTTYVLIVTRDPSGLVNIYINGVLSGTANQSSGTPSTSSPTYIGNNAALNRGLQGGIGFIAIYNSILNSSQITLLTNFLRTRWGI